MADAHNVEHVKPTLQCVGCGEPSGTNRPEPICRDFQEQDDGERRVDTYCAACGHSIDCHDPELPEYVPGNRS